MSFHGPARHDSYLRAHAGHMTRLYDRGFAQADNLCVVTLSGHIQITGQIACMGNIIITVDKTVIALSDEPNSLVVTSEYNYNATVCGFGNILRHDNAGHHHQIDPIRHPTVHHRHNFDWRTDRPLGPPVHVGEEGWPTLAEFVDLVAAWYAGNFDDLPGRNMVPALAECHVPRLG